MIPNIFVSICFMGSIVYTAITFKCVVKTTITIHAYLI